MFRDICCRDHSAVVSCPEIHQPVRLGEDKDPPYQRRLDFLELFRNATKTSFGFGLRRVPLDPSRHVAGVLFLAGMLSRQLILVPVFTDGSRKMAGPS